MSDNAALEYIAELVRTCKDEEKYNNKLATKLNGSDVVFTDSDYLLGQVIRHYQIDEGNWYISQNALKLWSCISKKSIWDYTYQKKVVCTCERPTKNVKRYKGQTKEPCKDEPLHNGETFAFREVFHDEHMTDVRSIKTELFKLDDLTPENIKGILDKIRIARILKEEDKKIGKTYNRGTDIEPIMKLYEDANIKLIPRKSMQQR